jgi:hypothetical protein
MIKVDDIPRQIRVEVLKSSWTKRRHQFLGDDNPIGELYFPKSYIMKATANIRGKEFTIQQGGFWRHHIKITSDTEAKYNMQIDMNWRGGIKIVDTDRNPFELKATSIWKNKWALFDRHARAVIDINSKTLSKKNRGIIDIKYNEMKDPLFWIVVSWFVIISSESEAAMAAG